MTTFELELEESEAVEEGNTAAGSSDELLYTLLSTLVGTEPGDHDYYPPAFLPKLQYVSLRLPNLTLDETVVDKVRETVLESVMNVYCDSSDKMLEEFWLTRTSAAQNDDTAKVTALLHSPFLSKTLKELEENWGVSVVIEDCAHPVLA
ncbi:hypothetical protein V5O48_017910 [Marasmius crinis-equi]|uniref:Uncharacterized protein n=1 Tax=Marasmius crinis-equi TaxID=585013 RepID=A0ABR3EMM8_9AGAR